MIPENDAEKRVLAAFRAGKREVLVKGEVIGGDFLRWLFLGEDDKKAGYRGACIVGAIISDVLNMEFCEAKFPVRFRNCSFASKIKLQQLTCPELGFSGCTLKKGIDALGAKVAGDVHLTKVNAKDQVRLSGAVIGGQLDCTGGSFWNKGKIALNAQGIKVAGIVFLCNEFNAEGAVWLLGAEIGGQLICRGSFQNEGRNALIAQSVKVAADVLLVPPKHGQKEEWENFSANGQVSFANATIGGDLELKNCELTHLSLAGTSVSGEFEDDAEVYKNDQGNDIVLNIDGFRYQRLNAVKERVKDRLAWVGLMSQGGKFYPQPYEQLMQVYRATGHTNWARDVGFELEKKRQEVMESWLWKGWYSVLRITIGYGYKPFRALACWLIPLIAMGFILFSGILPCPDPCRTESAPCHCMAPSDAEVLLSEDWKMHGKLPKDYPGFNPVYYAVEAALPVLPLGQTENWHPKTWWVRWLQGAITIIGALILAILASYGVGVLGPRWKNE